jgi:hypothetical protein
MSGPPTFPFTLPNPFLQLFPTGTPSPFNNAEQTTLVKLADGLVNVNPTLLVSGSQDVFNAEAVIQAQGLSLQNLITQLIQIEGVLTPANITNLSTILNNPSSFFGPILASGIGNAGAITSAVLGATSKISPPTSSGSLGVTPIGGKTSTGSIGSTLGSSSTTSGTVQTGISTSQSITLSTVYQGFIDSLFGMSTGSNDVFNILQLLYNFGLNNQSSLANLSTTLNAFNQAGLLSNSLNTSGIPYTFPAQNGYTFSNVITAVLTFLTQPGEVVADILLTPTSTSASMSASGNIYTFLNSQTGGAQGATAQSFVRPFVNALFGSNATSSPSPFDTLFSLISSPTTFFSGLFATGTFTGTSISPQNLIKDLISSPGTFLSDFAKLLPGFFSSSTFGPSLPSPQTLINDFIFNPPKFLTDFSPVIPPLFTSLFSGFKGIGFTPSTQSLGFTTVPQLFTDIFNNNLSAIPTDILQLTNLVNIPGLSAIVNTGLGLGDWLIGLISNLTSLAGTAFTGTPQSALTGFSDKITITSSGYSSTAPGPLSGLNGTLQGDLGFALLATATAMNEMQLVFKDAITLGSNPFSSLSSPVSTFTNAGADAQRLLSAPLFLSAGLMVALSYIMQLLAAVANIKNVLSNSGIPFTPGAAPVLPFNAGGYKA